MRFFRKWILILRMLQKSLKFVLNLFTCVRMIIAYALFIVSFLCLFSFVALILGFRYYQFTKTDSAVELEVIYLHLEVFTANVIFNLFRPIPKLCNLLLVVELLTLLLNNYPFHILEHHVFGDAVFLVFNLLIELRQVEFEIKLQIFRSKSLRIF